ncbi:MAG TPA: hypothetical protein VGM37_15600 [Armatimonadota bacterium]|jgi:RNA polymerase sigma-54 factor
MDFEFTQRHELRQVPKIVPEQIFAGRILQMPALELETFLRVEFQENPALLMEEADPDPALEVADEDDWEPSVAADVDDAYDPFRTVADLPTLAEALSTQLRTQFSEADWPIGLEIIESLDEDGYYRDDILDAADRHGLSVPEFEVYLAKVQALDPAGIGARDVRECLLLQVSRQDAAPELCRRLLAPDAWGYVARRDVAKLAEMANVSDDDVRVALDWIRDETRPYPAADFRSEWENLAPRSKPLEKPDVIVRYNGEDLWVDCPGLTNVRLSVDPFYTTLYQRVRRVRGVSLAPDDRHVVDLVDRANLIAFAVDLRGQTLHRIADTVVQFQKELVLRGARFARAYTQKQVAETLGVHESTVCRATAGKLIQLPSGETVPFDHFFDAALPVRDLVAEIIGHEDPSNPLKDGQVAQELERRGVRIARRTVAKYRDHLHILPCEMRRAR